ncbi:SDR family NAD(P)-dependent oxidoreductase [Pimelobacter sp. 30-1]|uniref:SDR family NAD(P)-dependent oxidoreductase n=1 Tax=Pimelobacter sp. 30-1 TaxID=2004991 RepID=UPI001C03A85F|nr:SDR family NAD(P)-dependent oxidoreductase [Pimelobacter sp. 30-1]MBU2694967.1 oxidoreductase [Pimelobacter sp. 30-1]
MSTVTTAPEALLSLAGRTALVTGAGQGVGREVALTFARHGADAVVVNDYDEGRARAVAAEVEALGARALVMATDITDFAAVTEQVEAAVAELGALHVVVNNAGNAGPRGADASFDPFWDTTPDDWQAWLGTNLFGTLNVTRAALPALLATGTGSVVNVISDAGRVGEPHMPVYSAAKAGVAGFSRALAKGTGRLGVRVNAVSLGSVRTPGVEAMIADPKAVEAMLRQYLIRRLGEPADAANMILFLASDASSWITGQTYPVNGGYSVSF